MSQIPSLISDLAVILISAGLVTLLFKWLKQPVVLGYIVAGLLAGPSITQIPTVTNVESIRIWADIGVIFLLFALGLDFSFKKLMKVGGTAVIGAITIVIGMMTLGYTTGLSLGWGHMNSLFLGGMLSMSSTTIIFKAFDDMGLRNQRFAGVVFGILVVEDLFAVLLMVLLSTLAVSKHVEGMELLNSVVKLGVFLLFCFVIGIYLIPSFLKKARTFLNDETLLIVSLGLCLGMVIIATKAGFSSALGAFVMGSILAETIDAEHIDYQTSKRSFWSHILCLCRDVDRSGIAVGIQNSDSDPYTGRNGRTNTICRFWGIAFRPTGQDSHTIRFLSRSNR